MKRWWVVAIGVFLGGCAGAGAQQEQGSLEGAVFVDVRSVAEYRTSHLAGAVHIPHDQMAQRWRELEQHRGERLVVYCQSGVRSRRAVAVLRGAGFPNVEDGGGIRSLVGRGAPLASPR
jgi:phage shock protein E